MNWIPSHSSTTDNFSLFLILTGDATKLLGDYGIQMKGILELSDVARHYDPEFQSRRISLANIVARYLGKELQKGPVRCSNWETKLNEEQMECE